jgi:hypothetical protein
MRLTTTSVVTATDRRLRIPSNINNVQQRWSARRNPFHCCNGFVHAVMTNLSAQTALGRRASKLLNYACQTLFWRAGSF